VQRALLAGDPRRKRSTTRGPPNLLQKSGDKDAALARLEQANDLDPMADEYAMAIVDRYTADESWQKLVQHLAKRGDRLSDRSKRVGLRTQAATLFATKLNDKEGAREQWLKVLEDGDDREALEKLIDYAVEREDHTEAATLLRRLGNIAVDKADKARVALREAELLAEGSATSTRRSPATRPSSRSSTRRAVRRCKRSPTCRRPARISPLLPTRSSVS